MPTAEPLPQSIGVFGGSFNPIHLGHALLAITTQQTKPVDSVVLVPVFKHHVKTDLLPFEDRVAMCELAVAPFRGKEGASIHVSTIEKEVGESNAAMLRALKKVYPEGSKLFWICGDDVFDWIENPKGLETMQEVSGLIVQRRLHKSREVADQFFKSPVDESKIRQIGVRLNLHIEFIYGELPHFSSTLVRQTPGNWRTFLPQSVAKYLDARPALLAKLHENLDADAKAECEQPTKRRRVGSKEFSNGQAIAAACVIHALNIVHALQRERGRTGLRLSMGLEAATNLQDARRSLDETIHEFGELSSCIDEEKLCGFEEALALAAELKLVPAWLHRDRAVADRRAALLTELDGAQGWSRRAALLEKFDSRIEVIIGACVRSLSDIVNANTSCANWEDAVGHRLPKLVMQWSEGKEALGRLRAFICAGGPNAANIVKSSLMMRQRLQEKIDHKDRRVERVLSLRTDTVAGARLAAPDALHHMLEKVTAWEWTLLGCFSTSTPLALVHKLLSGTLHLEIFDVEKVFADTSQPIDLMLTFIKLLAATACAKT